MTKTFQRYEQLRQRILVGNHSADVREDAELVLRNPELLLAALDNQLPASPSNRTPYETFIASAPRSTPIYEFLHSRLRAIFKHKPEGLRPGWRGRYYAWSWGYWGRAAVNAFNVFQEERYITLVAEVYEKLLEERDDYLGLVDDIRGRVVKSWGLPSPDGKIRSNEVTSTGLILLPVCDLLLGNSAQVLPSMVRDRFLESLIEGAKEFSSELQYEDTVRGGYFRDPFGGAVEALNHSHIFGAALAKIYQLTQLASIRTEVEAIARYFLASCTLEENDSYSWPYAPLPGQLKHEHRPMRRGGGGFRHDIGGEAFYKAAVTIEFPVAAYDASLAFSRVDMERIADSFAKNVFLPEDDFNVYVSPRKIRPGEDFAIKYRSQYMFMVCAGLLDEIRPSLRYDVIRMLGRRPDWFPEGWFGQARAGIMMLTRFMATGECLLGDKAEDRSEANMSILGEGVEVMPSEAREDLDKPASADVGGEPRRSADKVLLRLVGESLIPISVFRGEEPSLGGREPNLPISALAAEPPGGGPARIKPASVHDAVGTVVPIAATTEGGPLTGDVTALRFIQYAAEPELLGEYLVDQPLAAKLKLPHITGYPLVFSNEVGSRILFRVAAAPVSGRQSVVKITRYVLRDAARNLVVHDQGIEEPFTLRRETPHSYRDDGAGYTTEIELVTGTLPASFYELVLIDADDKKSDRIFFNLRPNLDNAKAYQCVCILPTFTWQAYNFVGGGSFYSNNIGDPKVICERRPLLTAGPNDPRLVFPLFQSIVKGDYDFYCLDNMDVHNGLLSTKNASVAVLMVHDEYFTQKIRDSVEGFVNSGGAVVVIGGNTCCRVTTYDGKNLSVFKGKENNYWEGPQGNKPTESLFGLAWRFGGYPLHREPMVKKAFSLSLTEGQVRQAGGMRVVASTHPIFGGTNLSNNDWFGVDVGLMNCEADGVYVTLGGFVDRVSCPLVDRKAVVLGTGIVACIGSDRGLRDVGVMIDVPVGRGRVINLGSMGWPRGLGGKDDVCEKIVLNAIEIAGVSAAKALRRTWKPV